MEKSRSRSRFCRVIDHIIYKVITKLSMDSVNTTDDTDTDTDRDRPWDWIFNITEIAPGKSAILGGNEFAFYGIHGVGILIILFSLTSCLTVISTIYRDSKKRDKWDFSDRFPLYLAISDGVWAISNLAGDQIVLLVNREFPSKPVATWLSLLVAFFFGYQQFMNAGLCLYTYLKVVRHIAIDLGYLEWKLQLSAVVFMITNLAIFYPFDAYGAAGFWFLNNVNTTSGAVLTMTICILSTFHAVSTLVAYRAIQQIINRQRRRVVSIHEPSASITHANYNVKATAKANLNLNLNYASGSLEGTFNQRHQHYHSTATNCLTTFVYISICLYFPFAISAWAFFIETRFGFIEPFIVMMIVILANSGGWVNAWGYFHNKKIKDERRNAITKRSMACTATSSSSNSNA